MIMEFPRRMTATLRKVLTEGLLYSNPVSDKEYHRLSTCVSLNFNAIHYSYSPRRGTTVSRTAIPITFTVLPQATHKNKPAAVGYTHGVSRGAITA